jgi:hypothetical protein
VRLFAGSDGRTRPVAVLALIAAIEVLALTACGSGGSPTAPQPSASAMTDAQIQVLVNDLVQCIRDNGAPGMPDVRVENGKVIDPEESLADEATKRNVETALDACKPLMDRIPPSALEEGQQENGRDTSERREPTAQDVPALRKFADCMRQNGVPDWPDPRGDGTFPAGAPITTEGKSPRIIAGFQACGQYWNGSISVWP